MHLTIEEVRHVAELAKLRLSEQELVLYAGQLSAILEYAERLQQVDTSRVVPTPYVLPLANVWAEDLPDREDGFFRVRAVFEE